MFGMPMPYHQHSYDAVTLQTLQNTVAQLQQQIGAQNAASQQTVAPPPQAAVSVQPAANVPNPGPISVNIAPSGANTGIQLNGNAARYSLSLPKELDTDPKSLDWFEWAPTVKQFFASINCPDIISPPPRSNRIEYFEAQHAQCVNLLLQMIPARDRVWYIKQGFRFV